VATPPAPEPTRNYLPRPQCLAWSSDCWLLEHKMKRQTSPKHVAMIRRARLSLWLREDTHSGVPETTNRAEAERTALIPSRMGNAGINAPNTIDAKTIAHGYGFIGWSRRGARRPGNSRRGPKPRGTVEITVAESHHTRAGEFRSHSSRSNCGLEEGPRFALHMTTSARILG